MRALSQAFRSVMAGEVGDSILEYNLYNGDVPLIGVEFDDTISGVEVKHGCLDRKLLITAIGAHIIRMIPPLIVTEEQCDEACAIIEETVKALI